MSHPTMHIGRALQGHAIEDSCPCAQEPCGLVNRDRVDSACPHHTLLAAKTIRQSHTEENCPARFSEAAKARRERGVA